MSPVVDHQRQQRNNRIDQQNKSRNRNKTGRTNSIRSQSKVHCCHQHSNSKMRKEEPNPSILKNNEDEENQQQLIDSKSITEQQPALEATSTTIYKEDVRLCNNGRRRRKSRPYRKSKSYDVNETVVGTNDDDDVDEDKSTPSATKNERIKSLNEETLMNGGDRPKKLFMRSDTDHDMGIKVRVKSVKREETSNKNMAFNKRNTTRQKLENHKTLEKGVRKEIATYLNGDDASNKNSRTWLTDLADDLKNNTNTNTNRNSQTDSDSNNNDCVFVDGSPTDKFKWRRPPTGDVQSTACQVEPDDFLGVNCTSTATNILKPARDLSVELADTVVHDHDHHHHHQGRDEQSILGINTIVPIRKSSLQRYMNLRHFFRYPPPPPPSQLTSTSSIITGSGDTMCTTKQLTSTSGSDSFDLSSNFSKLRLTHSTTRMSSRKLSITDMKLLIEKNLVATLTGLYILLSLAIIVVLILPYIFDFNRHSIQTPTMDRSQPIIKANNDSNSNNGAPLDQALSLQRSSSGIENNNSEQTQNKGTQTDDRLSSQFAGSPDTPSSEAGVSSASALSQQQSIQTGSDSLQQQQQQQQELTMSDSEGLERVHLTVDTSSKRYKDLWLVKHQNQQCQPMKVPFCSRSLATILSDTGISLNRHSDSVSFTDSSSSSSSKLTSNMMMYDKTLLPNQFTRSRQSQIEKLLQKYEPIVDIKCYALMPLFLCSVYAPKCVQVPNDLAIPTSDTSSLQRPTSPIVKSLPVVSSVIASSNIEITSSSSSSTISGGGGDKIQSANDKRDRRLSPMFINHGQAIVRTSRPKQASNNLTSTAAARLIPPCRNLCKEAFRKCQFFFEVLSLKILEQEDCDSLPDSSDPLVCVGHLESELLQRAADSQSCGEDKFRCTDGECISKKWRCDGFNDCTDKSDEMNCSKCNAITQFYCGLDVCISKEQVCNGIRDCRDGRDERQCLRLSSGAASIAGGRQQLQAWSATKDSWIPICGAHWSALPMSHQACQALGYSRANETSIIYGSLDRDAASKLSLSILSLQQRNASNHLHHLQQTTIKLRPSRLPTAFNHPNTTTTATTTTAATKIISQQHEAGYRRGRRSTGGWFDSYSAQISDTDGDDENTRLAKGIVEDVAAKINQANLDKSHRVADHLINYERIGDESNLPTSHVGSSSRQVSSTTNTLMAADLVSIDAAKIKLKSLTSLLYYGPEAGCLGQSSDSVSAIYLQCQNFQCGRAISSYSTRVRMQQRLSKRSSSSISIDHSKALKLPADEPIINVQGADISISINDDDDDKDVDHQHATISSNEGDKRQRIQRLEATEEFSQEVIDEEAGSEGEGEIEKESKENDENHSYERHNNVLDNIERPQSEVGELIPSVVSELSSAESFRKVSSRWVVGGIESMPGEFPYLAALHGGPDEVFFCGGVLISINWLLTAAHCVGNRTQPDGWMVKVGVTRRIASPAFVKKLKVRKIIKHPDYDQEFTFNNDIALILLEESVEYNQYLRPICLPTANLKLKPENSKDCVVVGFGKSKFSQEANYLHVAHFVNVPIVNHAICSDWYADHGVNLTEGMLCAGYAEGKRDACQGDSGSGLFCRYSNTNQFFVAGVVSFGIKCATPKLPGVYTSVPSYVNWVQQVTRQHGYPLA